MCGVSYRRQKGMMIEAGGSVKWITSDSHVLRLGVCGV